MSEKFLDCRHTWDDPGEDSYCTSCAIDRSAWNFIQRSQTRIAELLAACELALDELIETCPWWEPKNETPAMKSVRTAIANAKGATNA